MNGQQPGYWIENGVLWYASDSSGDFRSKHKVEEADLPTLKIYNRTWAKDDKRVWLSGAKLRKAYSPAFQALNASFGRDNECVFDSLGRVVKGINAAAFEVLDDGLLHHDYDYPRDARIAGYARCEGKIYHYERVFRNWFSVVSASARFPVWAGCGLSEPQKSSSSASCTGIWPRVNKGTSSLKKWVQVSLNATRLVGNGP